MPRKRKSEAEEEPVEKRVTRRSLRQAATPKKEEPPKTSPPKSQGKGRGRPKKSTDKTSKKNDEDETEASEKKTATPAKASSSKTSRRSPRASTGDAETASPKRRSARGASKAASEAISSQADEQSAGDGKPEQDEEARGLKRKAEEEGEEVDAKADGGDEKRQKVEDEADGGTEAKEDAATEEKPDEAAATDVATKESKAAGKDGEESKQDATTDAPKANAASKSQTLHIKIGLLSELRAQRPPLMRRRQVDEDCAVCSGVNIGRLLSCLDCAVAAHSDCLAPVARAHYLIRQARYDFQVWLCAKCEEKIADEIAADTDAKPSAEKSASPEEKDDERNVSEAPAPSTSTSGTSVNNNNNRGGEKDVLLSRNFVLNPNFKGPVVAEKSFNVVSYNILAECHAIGGFREKQQYKHTQDKCLSNAYRHPRLLQELFHLDADIYCLQECPPSYYEKTLKFEFEKRGFHGVYMAKCDGSEDAEVTLFNGNRFRLLRKQNIQLCNIMDKEMISRGVDVATRNKIMPNLQRASVCLLMHFLCLRTGQELTVANIHVAWEKLRRPDIQCTQISTAIRALAKEAACKDNPFIICGDFNSPPDSPGYQLARDGRLSGSALDTVRSIDIPQGGSIYDLHPAAFGHEAKTLKSAYSVATGNEPISSCFPSDKRCLAVDYIWFASDRLQLIGVLQAVEPRHIAGGIPNQVFPSDHLSIKANFQFLKSKLDL